MKILRFHLDAHNLNNPTLKYFALNDNQPRSIYQSGRQYYLTSASEDVNVRCEPAIVSIV